MNQLVDGIICLIAQLTSPSQNDQTASACVHDPVPEMGIILGLRRWLIIHNLPQTHSPKLWVCQYTGTGVACRSWQRMTKMTPEIEAAEVGEIFRALSKTNNISV